MPTSRRRSVRATTSALRLLPAALWSVVRIRFLLRARGFGRTLEFVDGQGTCEGRTRRNFGPLSPPEIEGRIRAIRAVCRRFPGRDSCLIRSLSILSFLRSVGVAADLRLAISLDPFRAHAWVESEGRALTPPVISKEGTTLLLPVAGTGR